MKMEKLFREVGDAGSRLTSCFPVQRPCLLLSNLLLAAAALGSHA